MMSNIVIIALFVFTVVAVIVINNQIIRLKNQAAQAFGSIEIYLKKRFDLIPNLVAMVNKYMTHEKDLLLQVTALRSQVEHAKEPKGKIEASNKLTTLMGGLNINVENYPDLKADKQFHHLQFELTDIEDQISAARRAYNSAVIGYNNKIQMFPASLVASIRKDQTQLLLEIPKAEQKEVDIKSLFNN